MSPIARSSNVTNPIASWGRTSLSWGWYCITGAWKTKCKHLLQQRDLESHTPTPKINHVILTLIWVYRQEQELICDLCDTLTDLMKPVWTVSYRWGTAVGGLFFDTTLQGAGQGSQSLPNSHNLNSSHQNVSRRKSCGLYQCWAQSWSVDTWQDLVVGSPPLVGGLLCPL